jgi:hypothetical protein
MVPSPILLLAIPAFGVSIPLLLWQPGGWPQAVGSLGLIGLGASAWIDVLDNCGAGCVEHDPPLLSGAWAVAAALFAVGAVALCVRVAKRARARRRLTSWRGA